MQLRVEMASQAVDKTGKNEICRPELSSVWYSLLWWFLDKQQRKIVYKNEEVKLGAFEYDILLFLLKHVGVAVNRERINQILPERKRDSLRNVDTHIKNDVGVKSPQP